MLFTEKYRPKTFSEFVGNEKTIAQVKGMIEDPSFDRGAFWLEGASGIGKTSLALLIAQHFKAEVHQENGRRCNAEYVQEMDSWLRKPKLFKTWTAWVFDEAHSITRPAIQELLTVLEHLPEKTLVIFTTTESLWPKDSGSKKDGLFREFTKPFARRVFDYRLSNQGLAESFAKQAHSIAQAEGKNGLPFEAYVKAVKDSGNCLGEVLKRIQQGGI